MGKSISTVKEEARLGGIEDEKLANDGLNSLMEIAKQNLAIFELDVKNASDKTEISINKTIKKINYIQCAVEHNSEKLKNAIGGLLGDVVNGDFLNAITRVVDVGLDTLFGNYQGNMSELRSYSVSVGTIGGFYRIDYYMYAYKFTSESLVKVSKNVVCCAVIISSVKTEDLEPNDVNVILQTSYGDLPTDQLRQLQSDIYQVLGWDPPSKRFSFPENKVSKQLKSIKLMNDEKKDEDNVIFSVNQKDDKKGKRRKSSKFKLKENVDEQKESKKSAKSIYGHSGSSSKDIITINRKSMLSLLRPSHVRSPIRYCGLARGNTASIHKVLGMDEDHIIPATFVVVGDKRIPQFAPTVYGKHPTKYDPPTDCEGYFMPAKFMENNNCYNYAVDIATNSFAQPGRKHNKWLDHPVTGKQVSEYAVVDGLVEFPNPRQYPDDKYLNSKKGHCVALLIAKPYGGLFDGDYHWVRYDQVDKLWSHKPGKTECINYDYGGATIQNPANGNWTINLGPTAFAPDEDVVISYEFYSYMFVPEGNVDII